MSAAQEEATIAAARLRWETLNHRNNVTLDTSWTVELARIGHGGFSPRHPDIIYMIQRDSERERVASLASLKQTPYTSVFKSAYCVCMLMTSRVVNVRIVSVY